MHIVTHHSTPGHLNTMNNAITQSISYFKKNSRALFLVDSIGAFCTGCFIYVAFLLLADVSGLPTPIRWLMVATAIMYCLFSAACYLLVKQNRSAFLKAIGIANLLYCIFTWICVLTYFKQLTTAGLAYFVFETVVIAVLAFIELQVAAYLK